MNIKNLKAPDDTAYDSSFIIDKIKLPKDRVIDYNARG